MSDFIGSIGLLEIVTGLLFVVSAVFGGKLAKFSIKLQILSDLLEELSEGLEDGKLDKKEIKELVAVGKKLFSK